jgi:hypothetical protein
MRTLKYPLFLGILAATLLSSCNTVYKARVPYTYKFEYGKSVLLRDGRAIAPKSSPSRVKAAVAAGNRLQGKPYQMGGGHRSVEDHAYDCSGTVSYALINAGLLRSPLTSGGFRKYGEPGPGRWITIYAKDGHTFMSIGRLRLDTSYRGGGSGPSWTTNTRPAKGYVMRHPRGL